MQTFNDYLQEEENKENEFKTEFEIPEHNLDYLKKKIEKLNKIAEKLGVPAINVTIGNSEIKEIKPARQNIMGELEPAEYMNFYSVKVEGNTPKLAGWSFVGKLEPVAESDQILAKTAPGAKQLPKKYQHVTQIECEHCNKRVRRNETFIIKKGKNYKQVGRSCLKDFLGHEDPKKVADWSEVLYDLQAALIPSEEREGGYVGRGFYAAPTDELMARAFASIKKDGFKSKQITAESGNISTADALQYSFNPPPIPMNWRGDFAAWFEKFKIEPSKEDIEQAKQAKEFIVKNWINSANEFEINTAKLIQGKNIAFKFFGYIAAAANNWYKSNVAQQAKQGFMSSLNNEHLGQEGIKHKIQATVISAIVYQGKSYSYYHNGLKAIVMMKSNDGHLIKMFTSNTDIQKDDIVEISGKIGRHEIEQYDKSPFKGMKVTIMAPGSRIKIIE